MIPVVNESSIDQNLISSTSGDKAASGKLAININFRGQERKKEGYL